MKDLEIIYRMPEPGSPGEPPPPPPPSEDDEEN